MKIKIPVHATWAKIKQDGSQYVILKEVDNGSKILIERLFAKKHEWEKRNNKEFYLQATLDLDYQKRTFKQNSAVWVLIQAIYLSMEKNPPDEEQKYGLYLDLLEQYADKVQTRFGGLRPVHISESNSAEGARFIDGLLYHLSTECNMDISTQTTVAEVMQQWEAWRGTLENDPIDYYDLNCVEMLPETEWRKKRPFSEASGRGGNIVRAHIVSRGADAEDIEKSWNWMALLDEEHKLQHQVGWDEFIRIYPHLRGRVERARKLAEKKDLSSLAKNQAMSAFEEGRQ